jgi:hypothetical protein
MAGFSVFWIIFLKARIFVSRESPLEERLATEGENIQQNIFVALEGYKFDRPYFFSK